MPELTLEYAHRLIARGGSAAQSEGMQAVFAVLDKGANLVAFSRMDGAWLASNELAIAKARTAVMFQAPTDTLNAPPATRSAASALRPYPPRRAAAGRRRCTSV